MKDTPSADVQPPDARDEVARGAIESVAAGGPLASVLEFLCRAMEDASRDGVIACIHPLDESASTFRDTAAPSLPADYAEAVNGMAVSSLTGPCCYAATTRQTVVVPEVAADPKWVAFQAFAEPLGIRSCWSTPIFSADHRVLGTFAHYYREPRDPSPRDAQIAELLTRAAAIAIERSRAEAALRESEARFRELADNISQFAWTADPAGRIYWYNKRWHEYTGTVLDDIEGSGWRSVNHPDHVDRVVQRIRHSFETGTPWEDTFPLRGRDGKYRWFLSRALPIRNHGGDIVRWLGTHTDITEQIDAEHAIRDLNLTLGERVEAETRERLRLWNISQDLQRELAQVTRQTTLAAMSASIAHEVSQPLAAIVANGQVGLRWLKSTNPDIAEIKASLEDMVAQADRASEILANIRAMFRGDPHESISLNVNDVVCDVLALVHGEIERHGIAVHRHLQEDLPNIVGERVPLQQTVLNLILNAIDAMSVVPGRARRLSITTEARQADGVLVTVGDTGVGIDAKDLGRILQPFFTTKPRGMGMGLPICQSIVAAHHGRLWATPVTPNGSTFHVYLPIAAPAANRGREVISIVDDDEAFRKAMVRLIKSLGHAVVSFASAEEFLTSDRMDDTVCLISDVQMPGMSGIELQERLNADGHRFSIIFVAASPDASIRGKALAAGALEFLGKPFDDEVLIACLERALARRQPYTTA